MVALLPFGVILAAILAPWTAAAATGATAPRGLTATPNDGRVTLRWTAPASDGGSPIEDIQVSVSGGTWLSLGVTAPPAVVAGLTNGVEYAFRIRAVTGEGPGDASEQAIATPGGMPGPITSARVTARTETSVTVAWSPPYDDGGSPVIRYEYSLDGGSWISVSSASVSLAGLTPGTTYLLRVRAVNASGAGDVGVAIEVDTAGSPGTVPPSPAPPSATASLVASPTPTTPTTTTPPPPGHRPSLPGRAISSASKPGVTLTRTADGRLLYADERRSLNPLAASVPSLLGVLGSLRNAVVAGLTALALAVLGIVLGAPAELLKSRIKEVWSAIAERFPVRRRSARSRRWIAAASIVAFLAAGQFLSLLNAPLDEFPPLRQDLQNIAYGVLAVLLMSHVKQRPDIRRHRDVHGDTGAFAAEWSGLLLTAVGVLVAQLTGLVPGFVVGVWAARRFRAALAAEESVVNTWRSGRTLIGTAIGAWVVLDAVSALVPDPTSLVRGFADSVLAMFVVGGTQGMLWSLTGPGEEVGRTLREWSLARWGSLVFLASFAVVGIVAAGGSETAAFFRPSWSLETELRILASGMALLIILAGIRRLRRRGAEPEAA